MKSNCAGVSKMDGISGCKREVSLMGEDKVAKKWW
jgi:hypothetical protein